VDGAKRRPYAGNRRLECFAGLLIRLISKQRGSHRKHDIFRQVWRKAQG
jgi:hypothetical protein